MSTNRDRTGFVCPACTVSLVMTERQGIEIDYCPQCRGVWLDRGELDKMIERSISEYAERPVPRERLGMFDGGHGAKHGNTHGTEPMRGHHGGRRKGFLNRLFD